MKQTAVEWYSDKLLEILGDEVNKFTIKQTLANYGALAQAKEMFEQQIIDAYKEAITNGFYDEDAEQYYNEKFKNK